jgi:hypothetical protein
MTITDTKIYSSHESGKFFFLNTYLNTLQRILRESDGIQQYIYLSKIFENGNLQCSKSEILK